MVFSLAIIWITSAVVVFVRDMSQIVAISIQFGFWITPIFWSQKILPEKYQFIISLNPAAYIVQGYRDSLIGSVWFFERQFETVFFWGITSVLLIFGMILFRRMRTHFADVM
ncbi:teichoic acid translocation permease protein Tag G [Leptospira ryugenii]|uniref:Teichoic acid translocation permease protein Tag G n=2 Tax=Leptospira ryugenii TaxID=1917863 RepID=A0A2P2DVX1_9LEPT|nr:teichoic acid translocation permease protein Tag G [Leptospira ryugenii]